MSFHIALCLVVCSAPVAGAETYTVQAGDTLGSIAEEHLGDASRWKEVAHLNGISDPGALGVGQILRLPAGDAEVTAAARTSAAFWRDALPASLLSRGAGFVAAALLVCMLVWWLLFAVSIRGACWFSLIESSLGRCALLALYLTLLSAAALPLCMWLITRATPGSLSLPAVLVGLLYLGAGVWITRRVLQCRWRSVLTVAVMTDRGRQPGAPGPGGPSGDLVGRRREFPHRCSGRGVGTRQVDCEVPRKSALLQYPFPGDPPHAPATRRSGRAR